MGLVQRLQDLAQFTVDAKVLEDVLPDLEKRHPNQWAGVYKGDLKVAHNLEEILDYFGDNSNKTVVKRLGAHPTLVPSCFVSAF